MGMASKIKMSLFSWVFALIVTLCLAENSIGENFSYQWNESGQIESATPESTKKNSFAYWYDASGYTIGSNTGGKRNFFHQQYRNFKANRLNKFRNNSKVFYTCLLYTSPSPRDS